LDIDSHVTGFRNRFCEADDDGMGERRSGAKHKSQNQKNQEG
jgi:hypothetical protein